jgi:hypothetical protein
LKVARPASAPDLARLEREAKAVLRRNDLGHMVTAAPALYPHQWSWDAALVSIGLAHISVERALAEHATLFDAQWSTGMIPHIIFSDAAGYFPGPDVWETDAASAKPGHVRTSGLCQPPVHAIALARILDIARAGTTGDARLAEDFIRSHLAYLVAWHEWLLTVRDPTGRDLVEIHHGWESGMDNSPRWDSAYANVVVPEPITMQRHDLDIVQDSSDRPTDAEYQRYLQLIKEMASVGYDDDYIHEVVSFRVTDVFMTAILAVAADELARMATSLGEPDIASRQRALAARARRGVLGTVDPETKRCRDFDIRAGRWIDATSIASWSLVICGGDDDLYRHQRDVLAGPQWSTHPSLAHPVPPSVSPDDPGFQPRAYWRGPTWPFLTWLLTWALQQHGDDALAATWRDACLALMSDLSFGEYYDPVTGEPAGSHEQSWSAAAVVDWTAQVGRR